MRVFHIVSHFDLGGAEKVALSICRSQNRRCEYHIVEVVRGYSTYSDAFIDSITRSGAFPHRSKCTKKKISIVAFPFWFFILFLRYRPEVIHSHTEIPDFSVFLFFCLFGWAFPKTKYVRTIHNTVLWNRWQWIGKVVERFFISHNSNVAISIAAQENYYCKYSVEPPIIYNGLEAVPQKFFCGLDNSKINVLFAGRLEPQKGIETLIQIINECKSLPSLVFWIVGTGSLRPIIDASLSNNQQVHLLESIYELSAYLSAFDYVLMPSVFEGLGLLSVEASFAKVPTIINNCPGLRETLPDDWPLKVENNCVKEYIELFRSIESFDKHYYGGVAYDFVSTRFSLSIMQSKYESFYQSL